MNSKYPPIEGSQSALCYWLVRGLGARGHEIHVVTNALEVEDDYREHFTGEDLDFYQPPGVTIHNTNPFSNPSYLPYAKPYTAKLASNTLEVIRHYEIEVIDSWYMLPYGVSGFIAKTLTGKPQILRHAASDISRLFSSPDLHTLFVQILRAVDTIVTYPKYRDIFSKLGVPDQRLFLNRKISVDTTAFSPKQPPFDLSQLTSRPIKELPVITFIGKFGTTKGIFDLVEALKGIRDDFVFVVVTGKSGIGMLKNSLDGSELAQKTLFLNFLPPWRVPSLVRASTCVVLPERDFPVRAHAPILPREVMASGVCLLLSEELYTKRTSDEIKDRESVIVVNPKDIEAFRHKLEWIIQNPGLALKIGTQARKVAEKLEDFQGYLDSTERLYEAVSTNRQGPA